MHRVQQRPTAVLLLAAWALSSSHRWSEPALGQDAPPTPSGSVGNAEPGARPLDRFALAAADPIVGDEIARTVTCGGSSDLHALAGQPIRLRFVMRDADVYSLRFE
jgi:hypothetical protein